MQRTSEKLWLHVVLYSPYSQNLTAVLIRPYYVFVVREKIKMTNDWRKKEISQGSKHIQDSWTPKPSDELMMLMTVNFLFIIYKPVAVFTSLFLSPCWIVILHIAYLTSFFRILSLGDPKKIRQIEMRKLTPFLLEIADFLSSTIDTITDLIQVRGCSNQDYFFLNFMSSSSTSFWFLYAILW